MHNRTLPVTGVVSGLALFLALSAAPGAVVAQDTPETSAPTAQQDSTTLPREIKPLFKGISLTSEQSRQVVSIYERHSGMGAGVGQDSAGMGDTLAQGGDTLRGGVGAGAGAGGHEAMFDEFRALLTSADQAIFDQNLANWKEKGHGGEHDSSSYGGQQDSTSKWNSPSQDSASTSAPSGSQPTSEPTDKP